MSKKFRRPQQKFRTATQVFDMIELSESAMRKLALGEELTDAEVTALFESDYVREGRSYPEFLSNETSFYETPGSMSVIHLIDVEREMFEYFS